jgi:APA family basic amino acid/polyamine antiporter
VHPRWHTPVFAIVCQGICSVLLTLTPFPDLVIYIGFTLTFMTVMSVSALLIFRRRPDWQKLRAVSFAFPLVPLVFILVGAWTIVYGAFFGFQNKPAVPLAAIATIATGALVYHLWLRPRQNKA